MSEGWKDRALKVYRALKLAGHFHLNFPVALTHFFHVMMDVKPLALRYAKWELNSAPHCHPDDKTVCILCLSRRQSRNCWRVWPNKKHRTNIYCLQGARRQGPMLRGCRKLVDSAPLLLICSNFIT